MPVALSPDDTRRFGVRAAKGTVDGPREVNDAIDFCRANDVRFVIVRCPARDTGAIHALESQGLLLMDTLVYFSLSLNGWTVPAPPAGVTIRTLRREEIPIVTRMAEEAFEGYSSHYHADPRLGRAACDAVYVEWSERLCADTAPSSFALLAFVDDEPAGYMAFRRRPMEPGEAVLGGVLERGRRRGVYRTLLATGIGMLRDRGADSIVVSSQITNVAVQKTWTRLGFEPHDAVHTFHGWF